MRMWADLDTGQQARERRPLDRRADRVGQDNSIGETDRDRTQVQDRAGRPPAEDKEFPPPVVVGKGPPFKHQRRSVAALRRICARKP